MIIALIILWLLFGVLGTLWLRFDCDEPFPLLALIILILVGPITVLVMFGISLWETEI